MTRKKTTHNNGQLSGLEQWPCQSVDATLTTAQMKTCATCSASGVTRVRLANSPGNRCFHKTNKRKGGIYGSIGEVITILSYK